MRDWVELDGLRMQAVLGVEDWEQRLPQPVELRLRLGLDLDPCAVSGDLGESVDYAGVLSWVETVVQQGRWRLIEALGRSLAAVALLPPAACEERSAIEEIEVRIRKPEVLAPRGVPGVRLLRHAEETLPELRQLGDGVVAEVVHESALVALARVCLQPGARVALPPSCAAELLAGDLRMREQVLSATDRIARGSAPQLLAGERGAAMLWVATGPL